LSAGFGDRKEHLAPSVYGMPVEVISSFVGKPFLEKFFIAKKLEENEYLADRLKLFIE
jgi:hypothetical protein